MPSIEILDCTLRDGGYINDWQFGEKIIIETINSLNKAKIDIIELGFLNDSISFDRNISLYSSIQETENHIPKSGLDTDVVLMINHGEFDLKLLENSSHVFGVRYAFHKNDITAALENSKLIKQKGYKLFLQPMVINAYTLHELENLLELINQIKPYAVYLVDSFGVLSPTDVQNLTIFFDKKASDHIKIGFHSHNNKQLSVANAITFVSNLTRDGIIDSSIYGMGRGAGNLNTEIIADFINKYKMNSKYKSSELLSVIDKFYYPLQQRFFWGYSLPFYLSAKYSLHPNYAKYLVQLDTLEIKEVEEILESIRIKDRVFYDKVLIHNKYKEFQSSKKFKGLGYSINQVVLSESIVIILPGPSYIRAIREINDLSDQGCTTISVNFISIDIDVDYVFLSNTKRVSGLLGSNKHIIKTSNVGFDFHSQTIIRYSDYINDYDHVNDNALLMLLAYLKNYKIKHIYIAGLDGYDQSIGFRNFNESKDSQNINDSFAGKNKGIERFLIDYRDFTKISFLTESRFVRFK